MPFLRPLLRAARLLLLLGLLAALALAALIATGRMPGRVRDPALDLGAMPGFATHVRLDALGRDATACRAALDRAGIRYRALPSRDAGACGFDDGIAWSPGGARAAAYRPAAPALACPLAAGLAIWEWSVVQPAAAATLGTTVVAIDHYGSYACRRIYGRASGDWSEHARADAIDVAGVRLADGRRITVAADWRGSGPEARFLHRIRNGACRLFGTTLSPDYNAAHRDHLHLDGADRGGFGVCR